MVGRGLDRVLRGSCGCRSRCGGVRFPFHGHVETAGGERLESWAVTGQLLAAQDDANPDGTAVLAGPVDLAVDAPADLVLRLTFGDDERAVPFRVIAAGA